MRSVHYGADGSWAAYPGWPHGGGTRGRFRSALLTLSLFGLCLHASAWLVKKGSGLPRKEGRQTEKGGVCRNSSFGELPCSACFCFWVGRPTMLRTMSDVFVSPPTHRVYPVRLCHSWCWLRGCRSCWFIRSIQAFNNDHKGPSIQYQYLYHHAHRANPHESVNVQ